MKRLASVAVLAVVCFLHGCVADTMNQKSLSNVLQVGLRSVANVVKSGDRAEVLFYLENKGTQPVSILPWNTPLEGELTADIFDINVAGMSLQYQGIMIKRLAPTESDYIKIAVGERREVVIDLADSYDMSAMGSYVVQLRSDDDASFRIDSVDAAIVTDAVTIVRQ